MFLQNLLLVTFGAMFAIHALILPPPAKLPRAVTSVETLSTDAAVTPKNLTTFEWPSGKITTDIAIRFVPIPTDISLVYERDDGGVSGVIQTLVTASYAAAGVVCVVGGLATAGAACITALVAAGISTALSVFYVGWTLYNETPGKPVTSLPRSVTNAPIVAVHSNFTPSADCNVKCQLENASPQQTWVHFGNTTSDTSFHTTHFYQSGALRGLKMKQYDVTPISKRQFTVGEWINGISPNWIQTVYWTDDSQAAFNDWNTAGTEPIAQWAGNYIWSNNAEVACLDLNDDGGTVFQGVWVTDDTDTEISLDDAAVNQYLVDCYNDDKYSTK